MTPKTSSLHSAAQYNDEPPEEFAQDVIDGLSRSAKALPSKYLYDQRGSELFAQITALPEYYLYRAEKSILQSQSHRFFEHLTDEPVDIIELGSGNGEKSSLLLNGMLSANQQPHYHHIDISESAVDGLSVVLSKQFPELDINGIHADYHELLSELREIGQQRHKAVLFLGSNIGNYDEGEAAHLLASIHAGLNAGDHLLIGFDLVKDYQRMIDAYNDAQGITAEFNLNVLTRMNAELGSNFDVEQFYHYEIYNPRESAMQSFLVSTVAQSVHFSALNFTAEFEQHEAIYMESSRKYTGNDIRSLAEKAGFEVVNNFYDDNHDFVDSLWRRR